MLRTHTPSSRRAPSPTVVFWGRHRTITGHGVLTFLRTFSLFGISTLPLKKGFSQQNQPIQPRSAQQSKASFLDRAQVRAHPVRDTPHDPRKPHLCWQLSLTTWREAPYLTATTGAWLLAGNVTLMERPVCGHIFSDVLKVSVTGVTAPRGRDVAGPSCWKHLPSCNAGREGSRIGFRTSRGNEGLGHRWPLSGCPVCPLRAREDLTDPFSTGSPFGRRVIYFQDSYTS